MSYKVWKYEIPRTGRFTLELPAGSKVLHFGEQRSWPCLWVRVNQDNPREKVRFRLAGTGHEIEETVGKYIGTVLLNDGMLVLHLFFE